MCHVNPGRRSGQLLVRTIHYRVVSATPGSEGRTHANAVSRLSYPVVIIELSEVADPRHCIPLRLYGDGAESTSHMTQYN